MVPSNAGYMLNQLIPDKTKRDMLMQVIRFGVSGVGLTALVAVLYTAQVYLLHISPNLATTIAIIIATFPGYVLHSQFSFKGHGERNADEVHIRTMRFAVTSFIGFLCNNLGTWLLVTALNESPRLRR